MQPDRPPCQAATCGDHDPRALPRRRGVGLWWSIALATVGTCVAPAAQAQGWSGALGVGSDNIYRGISLTDGRPAWLTDLHYDAGNGWGAGLGASAEHLRGQSAGAQLTAYLDRRWQLGDNWVAKAGVVHYDSPWNARSGYWRYDEINAAVGYRGQWTASIAVSPDRQGVAYPRSGKVVSTSVELTFHQALAGRWSGDLGVGYANLDRAHHVDYEYGSAGLSCSIADARLYLLALWTGPISIPYRPETGSRLHWVTSVVWSF